MVRKTLSCCKFRLRTLCIFVFFFRIFHANLCCSLWRQCACQAMLPAARPGAVVLALCSFWAVVAAVRACVTVPQRQSRVRGGGSGMRSGPTDRPVRLLGSDVTLLVASSCEEIRDHLRELLRRGPTCIGLDAEWRPANSRGSSSKRRGRADGSTMSSEDSSRDPGDPEGAARDGVTEPRKGRERVAVLQLASEDVVLVIQLLHATRGADERASERARGDGKVERGSLPVPSELRDLLAAPHIVKLGVGIHEDFKRLHEDYGVECRGYLDLRSLALQHHRAGLAHGGDSPAPMPRGLQSLAAHVGINLDKAHSVRVSDWEALELTTEQVRYAAEDALAALLVWQRLALRSYAQDSSGLHWAFTDGQAGGWGGPHPSHACPDLIDVKFQEGMGRKEAKSHVRNHQVGSIQNMHHGVDEGGQNAAAALAHRVDAEAQDAAAAMARATVGGKQLQLPNCQLQHPNGLKDPSRMAARKSVRPSASKEP